MSGKRKSTDEQTSMMTRRSFLNTMGAACAFLPVASLGLSCSGGKGRGMNGVQIGAISYSFRALPSSAEEVLGYLVKAGLTTVELMGNTAEAYAGAPAGPGFPGRRWREMSEEERAEFQAARAAAAVESKKWRLSSASMEKFVELRKMYDDAGVTIDILKLGDPRWSDEEIEYAFQAAKAIGARGISLEISNEAGERMAPFATKYQTVVGMHNHTQVGEEDFSFDIPLSYSPYNMLNLDIGHYVAGTSESPIPVIQKYHERISHLHLKDRKKGSEGGANLPWGQGDTPIAEVLQLLKREQYPITAMIELEYEVPEDSDVLTEVSKCAEYCREALALTS